MPNQNRPLPPDRLQAFRELYEEKLLGAYETVSGSGSTLMTTRNVRRAISHMIANQFFNSLLDVGCGDFNWMSTINLSGIRYLGVDCVETLIEHNQQHWMQPNVRFETWDIVEDIPKTHDLVLCRDLFTHFSQQDIVKAFNNIKKSGSRYIAITANVPKMGKEKLVTQREADLNKDSLSGYWHPGNMCSAPFFFPVPLFSIPETEPGKMLGVWRLNDLEYLTPQQLISGTQHNPLTAEDFVQYAFFRKLCALPFVEKIALFGSRSTRTNRSDSDIDLMVFCNPNTTDQQWLEICEIVYHADIPLNVDAMRYGETLSTIPGGYFNKPSIYRFLYER
jgi:hypothetical protein